MQIRQESAIRKSISLPMERAEFVAINEDAEAGELSLSDSVNKWLGCCWLLSPSTRLTAMCQSAVY